MLPFLIAGKTARCISSALFFVLPRREAITLERRCRGLEESLKIKTSDVVVVSFGKSGRTWLRVMISRFFHNRFALPSRMLIDHANFHELNDAVPVVFFTHDNYIRDFADEENLHRLYNGRRLIVLIRDPIDVAASQYFHWKYRMKHKKKVVNKYPLNQDSFTIFDFVTKVEYSLPNIIHFYNNWIEAVEKNTAPW